MLSVAVEPLRCFSELKDLLNWLIWPIAGVPNKEFLFWSIWYSHTKFYVQLSFRHKMILSLPFLSNFIHGTFAIVSYQRVTLNSAFTRLLNPECPLPKRYIESGRFALADIRWPRHDHRRFSLRWQSALISFSILSLPNVPMLSSPLLTNRCQSGMNCRLIESRDWLDRRRRDCEAKIVCSQLGGLRVCCGCVVRGGLCVDIYLYVCVCMTAMPYVFSGNNHFQTTLPSKPCLDNRKFNPTTSESWLFDPVSCSRSLWVYLTRQLTGWYGHHFHSGIS